MAENYINIFRQERAQRLLALVSLITVCVVTLMVSIPLIGENIDNPNRIVYFNADEGGQMDLIWSYFSNHRRPSFQWDFDYGLEMVYLSDIARHLCSPYVKFTPGIFVAILRSLHLCAWIAACVALWSLVGRHFGKGWKQALAVVILGVRPAFVQLSSNLKPEPLVLFFIIIGLDYCLRIIDTPSTKNVAIASAFAALALVVKFAGVFLLPAIMAALYLARKRNGAILPSVASGRWFSLSWIAPGAIGFFAIAFAIAAVTSYTRLSTGATWAAQFGLCGALVKTKLGLFLVGGGLFLIACSVVILWARHAKRPFSERVMPLIEEFNYHALRVLAFFCLFILIFGFRWIVNPYLFLSTYAQFGQVATAHSVNAGSAMSGAINHCLRRAADFGPFLALLLILSFVLFCVRPAREWRMNWDAVFCKRVTLVLFLVPFLILSFSGMRMNQQHMLPFISASIVLVIEGAGLSSSRFTKKGQSRRMLIGFFIIFLGFDIATNAFVYAKAEAMRYMKRYDVSYEIDRWFTKNVPQDSVIVADQYTRVYLSERYPKVYTFKAHLPERAEDLVALMQKMKPVYVYVNEFSDNMPPLPVIETCIEDAVVERLAEFDGTKRAYKRNKLDKFVIYKIHYR